MKVAEQKIISCIIPKGKALPLIEKLSNDHGLTALDFNFARGTGRITPQKHRLIEPSEKELLTVMVSAELIPLISRNSCLAPLCFYAHSSIALPYGH